MKYFFVLYTTQWQHKVVPRYLKPLGKRVGALRKIAKDRGIFDEVSFIAGDDFPQACGNISSTYPLK